MSDSGIRRIIDATEVSPGRYRYVDPDTLASVMERFRTAIRAVENAATTAREIREQLDGMLGLIRGKSRRQERAERDEITESEIVP